MELVEVAAPSWSNWRAVWRGPGARSMFPATRRRCSMHCMKRSRRSGLRVRGKPVQCRGRSVGRRRDHAMTKGKRIHVLDTNVLMHDPTALFKFEEHDVFLPMQVFEELDNGKKGTSEASRNARQVSSFINALIRAQGTDKHRSEQKTSELQSIMRTSYAVFCL